MKTIILIALFTVFATLISCKKGDKGDTGPAGLNGSNGTNGNTDVKAFYFGKDSIDVSRTVLNFYLPSSVTSNMMDSSAVLVYYNTYGLWFPAPGLGFNATYQTRIYFSGNSIILKVLDPDGTAFSGIKNVFNKSKVIIIPSSDYKGSRKKLVDFNNYEATMRYYGLSID